MSAPRLTRPLAKWISVMNRPKIYVPEVNRPRNVYLQLPKVSLRDTSHIFINAKRKVMLHFVLRALEPPPPKEHKKE